MDGANYGDPFYNGLASSISGTVGSGNCSWGGGGDDNSADNVFEQLLASLVASGREATLQVPMQQQHPYQGIMNPNPTINFYSTQQMPHAAMGCPHGGDNSVARASFIPHELNGGILPYSNHPQYSYHNNVTMNLPHASFIAPTTMPNQPQILNQHFPTTSHPAFPTSMGPLPAACPVPKHSSHYNAAPPIISTPPIIPTTHKLHKQHRLALLFVKFGIFHRDNNSISANDVKKLLRAELTKEANQSWSIDLSSNTSADS